MEAPNIKNGDSQQHEKILVYLGPSLPLAKAREILPDAIYRPPAKQGDIVTDVVSLSPNRIILIDGCFRENLSPWHKEISFALQYPHLKAIYGAASMGALRASELDWLGMIGIGKIYGWYRDGVTEDDSEVAISFAIREGPGGPFYYPSTVPLVDIRAGVEAMEPEVMEAGREFLEEMRAVFYMERTPQLCEERWGMRLDQPFPLIHQKMIDARAALSDFAMYQSAPLTKPTPDHLSPFFQALYERDRRILINGQEVPQQHIDAYVMLHNPEYERIAWDAANQEAALLLCDCLCVLCDPNELAHERARFERRAGIETAEDLQCFLENNGWSISEFERLMIQNTRIRKLQHAMSVAKAYRRNTQSVLDYLRTHQGFDYWAIQVAQREIAIKSSGVDDWLSINLETPAFVALKQYYDDEGLEMPANPEDYLIETGFSNVAELGVAVTRNQAAKEL